LLDPNPLHPYTALVRGLNHPHISKDDLNPSAVATCGPTNPEALRRETISWDKPEVIQKERFR